MINWTISEISQEMIRQAMKLGEYSPHISDNGLKSILYKKLLQTNKSKQIENRQRTWTYSSQKTVGIWMTSAHEKMGHIIKTSEKCKWGTMLTY